jgi:UDP-2,3-diacylglucosamine pyrophosphatase LpxH
MRTLIVSDLHLGSASRSDVLRGESARAALVDALREVDRLVLLGDVLELRHGPSGKALRVAGPVLQELGAAMAGKQIVVLAGNHDHALVEAWLKRRSELPKPEPLTPAQSFSPEDASPLAASLARWAAPAEVSFAYPGIWLRDDVYATHGHYLDCHLTVPTLERLAIATMGRMLERPPETLHDAGDYEAVSAPVFAWIDAVAATGKTGSALNGSTTMRMWRALDGEDAAPLREQAASNGSQSRAWAQLAKQRLGRQAVRYGFPLAVAAVNRARLGPVKADVSTDTLRKAGLAAMGEVARRLDVGAGHVVFGHTHRAGPLPGDSEAEWTPGGVKLVNCGSWTYSPGFLTPNPGESAYWPGSCVFLDATGPPEVRRLLIDRSHEELRPVRS